MIKGTGPFILFSSIDLKQTKEIMTILVVGADGATGSLLVQQLLAGREA